MTKHDEQFQTRAEVIERIPQTTENIIAEGVAGDPDHKQIVGTFVEYQFGRNPCIGASKDGRERPLAWRRRAALHKTKIAQIDINDLACRSCLLVEILEQFREYPTAVVHAPLCGIGINRELPLSRAATLVAVNDLNACHVCLPALLTANDSFYSRRSNPEVGRD